MASKGGLHIYRDSGPLESSDYTTLVILHGFVYHSEIFTRLLPLAKDQNARVVLVNRRDHPGAVPYTDEERRLLLPPSGAPPSEVAFAEFKASVALFMQERAHELLNFLEELVHGHTVTLAQPARNKGGIVLVGWSMGMTWMTALLAHASTSPEAVKLNNYIRRIVFFDGPALTYGFPRPAHLYNPITSPGGLAKNEAAINEWVSGYFDHGGATGDKLEHRTPVHDPAPTLHTLSLEQLDKVMNRPAGMLDGSDYLLLGSGYSTGLFAALWKRALELPQQVERGQSNLVLWPNVEVRIVWCDRSIWEGPYAGAMVTAELEDARARRRLIRPVKVARLRGANHFVHWDDPQKTMRAFLAEAGEVEESSPKCRL